MQNITQVANVLVIFPIDEREKERESANSRLSSDANFQAKICLILKFEEPRKICVVHTAKLKQSSHFNKPPYCHWKQTTA